MPHTYTALDKEREEIRLISILDADPRAHEKHDSKPDSGADVIKCHLWHFSMRDIKANQKAATLPLTWDSAKLGGVPDQATPLPLTYVALSYTWGNPADTALIEVNGERVLVRRNLEAALRALRDKQLLRQGCAVWIDALCINQGDLVERCEEVGRMRSIYKNARAVVMWLGEEGHDGAHAVGLMRLLSESFRSRTTAQLAHDIRTGVIPVPAGAWGALADFMDRPYWSRVWILQEVAMGDRSMPVLCGNHALTWGELFDSLYGFASEQIDLVLSCIDRENTGNSGLRRNHIIQLNSQQQMQMKLRTPQPLPILDVARRCLATDDRDRVYGVLGMMDLEIASRTMVDYTKDVAEVYKSFARAVILSRQDLFILEECTWPPLVGAPSWVPNWMHQTHHRLFSGSPTYKASAKPLQSLHIDPNGSLLKCQGIEVGTIDGLGVTCYDSEEPKVSTDFMRQPRSRMNSYGSTGNVRAVIWKVLVGNRTPGGKVAPESYACLLNCAIDPIEETDEGASWRGKRTFNRLLKANCELEIGGHTLGSFFSSETQVDLDPIAMRDALERMFRFWRPRRLLVTHEGKLGAGPPAMLPGDKIFVVLGSSVPMVLRLCTNGTYKLVGCCYLQGCMEGEALRDLQGGKLVLHHISIS